MKILTVLGARPQFIKAAAVNRAIRQHNEERPDRIINEVIVHTGQHFDANMSDIFFEQLDIPRPDHNLEIANLSHGAMTGRMLENIEKILLQNKPDVVLVYGDTNSTLAGCLAAAKLHIPVAHVEAGLRSYNMQMPEEINRILTDRISSLLLCPTATAVENLKKEGIRAGVHNVGDVMYDNALYYKEKAQKLYSLDSWGLTEKDYVLCTVHRAENTDDHKRLSNIFTALQCINEDIQVIIPLHPRAYKCLIESGLEKLLKGLKVIKPVSFLEMVLLEISARTILTDSGGVQKEAFFYKVPCLTLREETEWQETVDTGWNVLTGANINQIIEAKQNFQPPQTHPKLFGDGISATHCISKIINAYEK